MPSDLYSLRMRSRAAIRAVQESGEWGDVTPPVVNVYTAPMPESDSTPPAVKAAWHSRKAWIPILLWSLSALGLGAAAEKALGLVARIVE